MFIRLLRFTLYDAITNRNAVTTVLTNIATPVTNGLFTVQLDFPSALFGSAPRWLDIGARTNRASSFVEPGAPAAADFHALRDSVAPSDHSDSATSVSGTISASSIVGTLSSSNIGAGTIDASKLAAGSVTSNAIANEAAAVTAAGCSRPQRGCAMKTTVTAIRLRWKIFSLVRTR